MTSLARAAPERAKEDEPAPADAALTDEPADSPASADPPTDVYDVPGQAPSHSPATPATHARQAGRDPRGVAGYELEEQLGTGATATVWRAWDPEHDRLVAVKILHPHLLADPVARRRLESEAASAARLSHPNIVPIVDSNFVDDQAALVFSFVEGRTLAARMEEAGGALPLPEAAAITADIADALAFAHQAGLVHRDVKPSNILVGDDGRARLLDFGISQATDGAGDLTATGMAVGTMPYMAPEQLAGGPAEPASDVYALGAVLYQMLAGRRPFDAAAPLALAAQQQVAPPPVTGAPRALVELSLSALDPHSAGRPSAEQMARWARGWLGNQAGPEAPTVAVALPVAAAVAVPTAAVAVPTAAAATPTAQPLTGTPLLQRPARRLVAAGVLAVGLALAVTSALAFGPDWLGPGQVAAPSTQEPSPAAEPTPPTVEQADQAPAGGGSDGAREGGEKNGKKGKGEGDGRGRGDDDDDDDD